MSYLGNVQADFPGVALCALLPRNKGGPLLPCTQALLCVHTQNSTQNNLIMCKMLIKSLLVHQWYWLCLHALA